MLSRYHQRVALVTGAGRGIGAAIARRLHDEGASVVLADRDGDAAAVLAADLGGERVLAVAVDVTARAELDALMARIKSDLGGLDLLVNNAGIIRDGFLAKLAGTSTGTRCSR